MNKPALARAAVRVGALGAGAASGLHVVVSDKATLASAATGFSAAAGLQVWLTNEPALAATPAIDGTAIRLAVRVLNKPTLRRLLCKSGQGGKPAGEAEQKAMCHDGHSLAFGRRVAR